MTSPASSRPPDPDDGRLAEEAAVGWMVRRLDREHWSEADEAAFRQWLAAHPRHAREFREAEAAAGLLASARVSPR